MAATVLNAGGPQFTVGSTADVLYEMSGNSNDFAKSLGIPHAYMMELTDFRSGFAHPEQLIDQIALPVVEGLLVLAREVSGVKALKLPA